MCVINLRWFVDIKFMLDLTIFIILHKMLQKLFTRYDNSVLFKKTLDKFMLFVVLKNCVKIVNMSP